MGGFREHCLARAPRPQGNIPNQEEFYKVGCLESQLEDVVHASWRLVAKLDSRLTSIAKGLISEAEHQRDDRTQLREQMCALGANVPCRSGAPFCQCPT